MYIVISFSHQNTGVGVRERLHFSDDESVEILKMLYNIAEVREVMLLSTCNRCEIYGILESNPFQNKTQDNTRDLQDIDTKILTFKNIESNNIEENKQKIINNIISMIIEHKNIQSDSINPLILSDTEAVRHIFCVASSLLSLVVGESQISGQLRAAFKLSKESGFCDRAMTRIIDFAFKCAAKVRSHTDIAKSPVSIASIVASVALEWVFSLEIKQTRLDEKLENIESKFANELAKKSDDRSQGLRFDSKKSYHPSEAHFRKPKILIIGAGQMSVLSLKHLAGHDLDITLCNRTREKAEKIIESIRKNKVNDIKILDFSGLKNNINDFSVVITAVSSGVIITADMIEKRGFDRIFFDLAMPRNIDLENLSRVKECELDSKNSLTHSLDFTSENIEVICIDDLQTKAREHIRAREQDAGAGQKIVDECVSEFCEYLSGLKAEPLIKLMRHRAKMASFKEIERAIKKGYLPEALRENATKLAHSIFNEFLHTPTKNLRAIDEDGLEYVYRLFCE